MSQIKIVCDEFAKKYGKEYMQQCRAGIPPAGDEVSKKLQKKLSPHAPPKALIENYLVEIAKVMITFKLARIWKKFQHEKILSETARILSFPTLYRYFWKNT